MATAGSSSEGEPVTLSMHLKGDIVGTILFFLRIVVILASIFAIIPLLGLERGVTCYYLAMQVSMTLYTVRLIQRKYQDKVPLFSYQFVQFFCTQDSGHYVWYSFFYAGHSPHSVLLIPLLLYAVFQAFKFAADISKFLPVAVGRLILAINGVLQRKQPTILRFIASAEIFLMPVLVYRVFSGSGSILAPIVHYYFLKWRYKSTRNPYVRIIFGELREVGEYLARHPRCPHFVQTFLNRCIQLLSSLV